MIPDFQAVMLPVLQDLAQGERRTRDTLEALALHFRLTAEELAERLPSGRQTRFSNRLAWAKAHLKGAGLLESPERGVYRLTGRGREVLTKNLSAIGMAFLGQFPEYGAFRQRTREVASTDVEPAKKIGVPSAPDASTPEELIDEGCRQLRAVLVTELRERIAAMAPSAFEVLVVELLKKMGYGGPQHDAALVVGKGGDEGIDGIIKQDRLGLETIYLQAKRWQGTVGRPEIQRFSGALQGQRARKGVFITASSFTAEARAYAGSIQTTIILIDGAQLADLMIDCDVGVSTHNTVKIKRIDSDYFLSE